MNLPFNDYLKRKNAYEAADASIVLWRKSFPYFIIFFAIPFWICAFVLRLLPGKMIYWSWLILWYLKPLFDRSILHIVSIKFFEPDADTKRLSKGLGTNILRGLFGDLLWRRFSPFRAATMPIHVLESNKKTNVTERKNILNNGGLGFCFLLSFWGLALEAALLIGELLFIFMMSQFIGIELDIFSIEFIVNAENYIFALWCFNYILVETIYVCMGFGVYINSRIEVEGWDIEIIFRNLAEKLKKKKMLGLISIFLFLFFIVPEKIHTEEPPLKILEEIYDSPDFGYEKDAWNIKLRKPQEEKTDPVVIKTRNNFLVRNLEYIFASGLRILIIITLFIAVFMIFLFIRRYIKKNTDEKNNTPRHKITMLHNGSRLFPEELLEKAINFYKQGDIRAAWGYCTALAITIMQFYRGVVFPVNATENDCVKIAINKLGETDEVKKFSEIIFIWINFAYAGHLPSNESFEEAISFCKGVMNG